MVCIYCGSETAVSNSRHQKRLNNVWRRRTCQQCHTTFTTTERPELQQSLVVKKEGVLRPFERDILFISVHASLGHRKGPVGDSAALTSTITALALKTAQNAVIEASQLATITHQVISRFDTVAAVHYAAYHPAKS
jgi:transcriptional repressor NrdR